MPYYNDPQEVHGGECDRCQRWVRDNEQELFAHGKLSVCEDCADELGAEPEDDGDDEPITLSVPRTDWFGLASHILEPWK